MLNTQTTANIVGYPASNKCHVPLKGFESRQSKVPVGVNANITGHTLKGAPLRKTASSGCPTSRGNYIGNMVLQSIFWPDTVTTFWLVLSQCP